MPRSARRSGGRVVTASPSSRMRPASGRSWPAIMLNRVVLPAPFGPITLTRPPLREIEIDRIDRGQSAEAPHDALHLEQHQTVPSNPWGRKRISSSSTTP